MSERTAIINGIGPDAPTTTNANGGKQSATPFRCDLLPPLATLAVAEVLASGAAKYGANNWHAITVEEHLNHAMGHQLAYLAGDTQDDHLEHAACRLLMALEQKLAGRPKPAKPEPQPIPERDMKPGILYRNAGRGMVEEVGPIKFDYPTPSNIFWKLIEEPRK